jgi:probable phosphoglycerate mutase
VNILLVRHGQTDENALGILQGHRNTRLNAVGIAQAAALAARLATFQPRIGALLTSDLSRAAETAHAVATAVGLVPIIDATWRERAFGDFEGRTLGEAELWRAAAGSNDLPGAEPSHNFRARVRNALATIVDRLATHETVAVATHGGPMRAVLSLLHQRELQLADDQEPPQVVPISNCSIMHLIVAWDVDGSPRWRLEAINDVDHLRTLELEGCADVVQE